MMYEGSFAEPFRASITLAASSWSSGIFRAKLDVDFAIFDGRSHVDQVDLLCPTRKAGPASRR